MRRKISDIMDEYLQDNDQLRYDFLPPLHEMRSDPYNEFPISPVSSDWVLSPCGKNSKDDLSFRTYDPETHSCWISWSSKTLRVTT